MKILQTSFLSYPRQSYQIATPQKQQNNQDVFVKSNSVAFTGNEVNENPYQQVLQNPTLTQKVMELITTAATILVGKAAGIGIKTNENIIDVENICKNTIEEQNDQNQEIEAYKQRIEQLERENSSLKELLEEKEQKENIPQNLSNTASDLNDTDKIDSAPHEENLPQEELNENTDNVQSPEYTFVFPKKKAGILSKAQKELKEITSQLNLDQESGDKLTQICTELLKIGSHPIDGQVNDNKDITNEFVKNLSSCTAETLPQVIDEFYKKCELEKNNPKILISQDKTQDEIPSAPKKPEVEIFETEKPVLPGLKMQGKIDLDSIKDRKRKRIFKTEAPDDKESSASVKTSLLEITDEKTKASLFRIPGTPDKDVMADLKRLLMRFEHQIEKEDKNPRYKCKKALGLNVLQIDILNELKKPNDHPYKHINRDNAQEIADAINSDPNFHKMFTLHAAMRLIDRFADFTSEQTLENQCHTILNKFTEVLQKSFKSGLEVRRYKDPSGYIGLRAFVSENAYDDEARAIFGTYPFSIGICENQPNYDYYNKHLKNPLISTIFTNSI